MQSINIQKVYTESEISIIFLISNGNINYTKNRLNLTV